MNKVGLVWLILLCGLLPVASAQPYTPGEHVNRDFVGFARAFLANHCVECHGKTEPEGGLSLHNVGPVDEVNAATWRSVWAQVTLKEMPPKDAEQPRVVERLQFSDWIVGELTRVMKDKGGFRAHLDPSKANFVDHDLLFGPLPKGIRLSPTSTPARIWRVTPQEHITRLNEFINTEAKYDPAKPGLRTHGDVVPTNHGGELKLYFGIDRIIRVEGGPLTYSTAVKSVPEVLSSARKHGLENYPDFYTVNSAEATQILNKAQDILKYMAYGPLSIANPEQITDDPTTYYKDFAKGELQGFPTAVVYGTKVVRPLTPIHDLMKEPGVTDERLRAAVDYLFEGLTLRPPSAEETNDYVQIIKDSIDKVGKEKGVFMGLSAIFLARDALFRPELVESGEPDKHGRVMLQDWELGLAVNHALRYLKPDATLRKSIDEGRMRTREDVKREVTRMLADDSIRKPRILRFFRDFFDYDLGGYICKDITALRNTGVPVYPPSTELRYYYTMFDAIASTDRLIELIVQEDKDVLRQLLTTDRVVVGRFDKFLFGRRNIKEEEKASLEVAKKVAVEQASKLEAIEKEVAELEARMQVNPGDKKTKKILDNKNKRLKIVRRDATRAAAAAQPPHLEVKGRRGWEEVNHYVSAANFSGPKIYARVSRRSLGNGSLKPDRILATVPEGQRLGILTHPSWLISHSDAMDNHAILRGRWIRERLLGGGIPDIPITVDAMLPDEPHNTLRQRMRVTKKTYCWTCHQKMDPLGLPFEMYNHAGIFRTIELERPVDTSGEITDSGDPALDGPVKNALEMIDKLSKSERVEQVFVRHAFRFWMGRNETLNDAPVLQEAYRAYKDSGGSMKAMITSLITSDAFLYRTRSESALAEAN